MKKCAYPLGLVLMFAALFCVTALPVSAVDSAVSGRVDQGIRILEPAPEAPSHDFTVFRGDPVKLDLGRFKTPPQVSLPALGIQGALDLEASYHFKVRQAGTYDLTIGNVAGTLSVVEYSDAHYEAVTPEKARELMADPSVFVLDVRTPGEYKKGRLAGSHLVPIRSLQSKVDTLLPHREKSILIYCASGNRSTVGAKILVDNGFTKVYNLRRGIRGWQKKGYPVEK